METTFVVGINLPVGVPTTQSVQFSLQATRPLNHYLRDTLIETIRPKSCSKLRLKCAKVHFRLTWVAKKRCCLSSLLFCSM